MSIYARQCDICGRWHEHYGGIHEPNMLDFRWRGFAQDSVTVERYDLCPDCRSAVMLYVHDRRDILRRALAEELKEEQRDAFLEMRNDAILESYVKMLREHNNKE